MTAFALAAEATLEDMFAYLVTHTGSGILHDNNNFAVKIQNREINDAFTVKILQRIKGVFNNIAGKTTVTGEYCATKMASKFARNFHGPSRQADKANDR